ncbi:MAG: serine/threonine protein kinase [Planctomycetales bacterium]|nr:serine/threonine protein kinase [Planctomycetales bacterium]
MDTPTDERSEQPSELFQTAAIINDRYRILDRIGEGGGGTVYRAADLRHDSEEIAIKVLLLHDIDGDQKALRRFINEVALVQQLSHPNIIEVYELSRTALGQHFLTMQYVAGGTVRDHIKESTFTFEDVLRILRDMARALHYAHSQSVVHRDLKPENILLTRTNDVKIADFGLARNMNQGFTMTPAGETVGTPYYMSPEQLQGKRVDGRSDIYSLGIVAFEMVTGERPFQHSGPAEHSMAYHELARMHFMSPLPSLEAAQMPVPAWFEPFLEACTAKHADKRYPSMNAVVNALEQPMHKMGLIDLPPQHRPILGRMINKLLDLD